MANFKYSLSERRALQCWDHEQLWECSDIYQLFINLHICLFWKIVIRLHFLQSKCMTVWFGNWVYIYQFFINSYACLFWERCYQINIVLHSYRFYSRHFHFFTNMLFITIGLSPVCLAVWFHRLVAWMVEKSQSLQLRTLSSVEEHLLLIKSEQLLPFTSTHFLFAD